MGWDFPGTDLRQGAIRISDEAPSGHPSSASRPFGTRGSRSERCKRAWFNVVYERGRKGSDEGRPRRFFGTSLAALFGLGNPKRVYRTRFGRLSPSSASKWRSPFGLRYVNRLEVPGQNVAIEDYLFALPSIPEKLPQQFSRWVQRVEIPYAQLRGILALQSGSIHEEGQEDSAFLLDLDFSTSPLEAMPLAHAVEWVERAHDEVERAFEACITPTARQLLQEVNSGE